MSNRPTEPMAAMATGMTLTASALQAMNAAAQQMLNAPPMSSSAVPNLATDEQTAQSHANTWLNTLEPDLVSLLKEIAGTAQEFLTTGYSQLVNLANSASPNDTSAQQQFTTILQQYVTAVQGEQTSTANLQTQMNQFHTEVTQDAANFTADSQQMSNAISSDQADMQNLQNEINSLQHNIDVANDVEDFLNGLSWILGIFVHEALKAVEAMVNDWVLDLDSDQDKINSDQQQISADQQQINQLNSFTSYLNGMITGANLLVGGLNSITAGLDGLQGFLNNVVSDSSVSIGPFLDAELQTLQSAFQDVLSSIETLAQS